ncbi:MAG: bifunctional adenosylcobinamide kinase/adenosylcobinamide-phosphate guanylyltransferase [Candidatus Melainabacteria bacterium GWF2_32_7]|nr:MAG: bifunctional adenosylcobinamide kinase/adenosylcobinamide-phosphate guanylyltransferase [Candidatus Melainabacteria bacterium GWF2_32_7]
MGKITFVLGGTRSGKSSYTVKIVEKLSERVAYVATCVPYDDEMHERVRLHKQERPSTWITIEEPVNLVPKLKEIDSQVDVIILDCLTLFVTNLLMDSNLEEEAIKARIHEAMSALQEVKYDSFIVSNEVGLGIVPDTPLGRKFRDVAGRANQIVGEYADEMFFVVSGVPMRIKG